MASCHRAKVLTEGEKDVAVDTAEASINENDSFIVVYRQPINGYKVKAVVKMEHYEINYADITFTKDGKSTSRWDRYLGMTAAMTQVPVPTAKNLLLNNPKC